METSNKLSFDSVFPWIPEDQPEPSDFENKTAVNPGSETRILKFFHAAGAVDFVN
jgi:hypothetical protein